MGVRLHHVLRSGIVAGVVVSLGEMGLNGVLLREAWEEAMRSVGRPPIGVTSIVALEGMSLALGIVTMALYAALRPSSASALGAVIRAAGTSWLLAYGLGFGWSFALGVFSAEIYLVTLVWSFVEIGIGTLLGARLLEAAVSPGAIAARSDRAPRSP